MLDKADRRKNHIRRRFLDNLFPEYEKGTIDYELAMIHATRVLAILGEIVENSDLEGIWPLISRNNHSATRTYTPS